MSRSPSTRGTQNAKRGTLPENAVELTDRASWRAWLAEHHAQAAGVWTVRYKKGAGRPTLSWNDIVEEAICFGWIDSLPRKLDAERTMLYVAPRKASSRWSGKNKRHVADLEAANLLAPPGIAAIERARADGSWDALDDVERLIVPEDLGAAFDARPGAREQWDGFPPSVRRGILEWILDAKRPATRQRRIEETAARAAVGERANQWRRA